MGLVCDLLSEKLAIKRTHRNVKDGRATSCVDNYPDKTVKSSSFAGDDNAPQVKCLSADVVWNEDGA